MGTRETLTFCLCPGVSGESRRAGRSREEPGGAGSPPHALALLQGQEMARAVGAVAYLECSARLQENVHAVFQEAVEVALSSRGRNRWRRITRGCCVLT